MLCLHHDNQVEGNFSFGFALIVEVKIISLSPERLRDSIWTIDEIES
jgi:hypothetical protein